MEDIINALLDVVRAQHSATEGTDEAPFNMDDVVDMALNLLGRPDEAEEEKALVDSIESMVSNMAPDIFPPKTFEQMDMEDQVSSVASMIEQSLRQGSRSTESGPDETAMPDPETASLIDAYNRANSPEEEEDDEPVDPANLNDMIYQNVMQMMGMHEPQVEYPFDRSQVRYGKEKSITELLEEEGGGKTSAADLAAQAATENRPLSAWELAQQAIDADDAKHQKEEYVPKPMEMPTTKSASQLAAEAIARSKEEDKVKTEIERRAEAMMEEARKLGKDPMAFALHQQEILRYMEKNSDELVSFEDYEDLTPEEKYEIEQRIEEEKRKEAAAESGSPAEGSTPESTPAAAPQADPEADSAPAQAAPAQMSDEMLRMLSEEVLRENSAAILAENADENMEDISAAIMENLRKMMENGEAAPAVEQKSVEELLSQAEARSEELARTPKEETPEEESVQDPAPAGGQEESAEEDAQNISAAEQEAAWKSSMAEGQADQAEEAEAAGPEAEDDQPAEPEESEAREEAGDAQETGISEDTSQETEEAADPAAGAADEESAAIEQQIIAQILEAAQAVGHEMSQEELAQAVKEAMGAYQEGETETPAPQATPESPAINTQGLSAVELAKAAQAASGIRVRQEEKAGVSAVELAKAAQAQAKQERQTSPLEELGESLTEEDLNLDDFDFDLDENDDSGVAEKAESAPEEKQTDEGAEDAAASEKTPETEDIDIPDDSPEEENEEEDLEVFVLGEHTQAEVDEAIENLNSLDLQGEVYERAKRMVLLELAGSEAELDAWLKDQNSKINKKKPSALDEEEENLDLSQLDSQDLESELDEAMDDEFVFEEEENADDGSAQDAGDGEEADASDPEEPIIVEPENLDEPEQVIHEEKEIRKAAPRKKASRKKSVVHKKDRKDAQSRKDPAAQTAESEETAQAGSTGGEKKEYQVSVRSPFVLKNSASYMDQFKDFIVDTQENRRLSTGFKKLDAMLRYGLHKGSYFIDSDPLYLKNGFMQQIADRAAESGVDVLYISTELSRYDLMVETISRLSFEIGGKDPEKAVSAMAIMTGQEGADLDSLEDELNWYRGRISEHLYIIDQEAVEDFVDGMEDTSAGLILEELIRSIVREGAHKPVVIIDNIENILSAEDSVDMQPLMDGIRRLARELRIPIILSYGYEQRESQTELYPDEVEFNESLGNMCDVYMKLEYADMITEDYEELTPEDIREMEDEGDTLLVDINLLKNRRTMRASCRIQANPKFNFFEE